jgi:hypothetical protein
MTPTYIGETTVPVAIFGANPDEHGLCVEVTFPELPLQPVEACRTVSVE